MNGKDGAKTDRAHDLLGISSVPLQPHLVITHPSYLGSSLILRIPEYLKRKEDGKAHQPGAVSWETVEPDRHLRYRWGASAGEKAEAGIDFGAEAWSSEGEVRFEVTMHNTGRRTNTYELGLFCLQAGAYGQFHDHDGERTFLRCGTRWRTVNDLIGGRWEKHRMCSFQVVPGEAGAGGSGH